MVLTREIFYVLLAELLIIAPSIGHIVLCSTITHQIRLPFCIISGLFILLDSFFLLSTVFKDPGILPKNLMSEEALKTVEINKQVFQLKICMTCKSLKSLRTHHCKVCNYCVDRLDHHCPWVANCIGKKNHRSFVLLLISTFLNSVYMLVANVIEMSVLSRPPGNYGGEIILIIYSGVLGWSILSLLGYQVFLIVKGRTTHEHRRRLFEQNPFDYGFWRNCVYFWGMKDDKYVVISDQNKA